MPEAEPVKPQKTILEQVKESKLEYSPQAIALLASLKEDFPLAEFEAYAQKEFFTIGGNHLLIFIAERAKTKLAMMAKLNPLNNIPNAQK